MAKGTLVHTPKNPTQITYRCRASKGLTKWCFALCTPVNGRGPCGRPAAHALQGRTQRAIARYLEAEEAEEPEA